MNRVQILEQFAETFAVPVAEAWNDIIHAATTGDSDTIAAYVRYAVAIRRADAERERIKWDTAQAAKRAYEAEVEQVKQFEAEMMPLRETHNRLAGERRNPYDFTPVNEAIADLNQRINDWAGGIGSTRTRDIEDRSPILVLHYTEPPSSIGVQIPRGYGAPLHDTFTNVLGWIINHQSTTP